MYRKRITAKNTRGKIESALLIILSVVFSGGIGSCGLKELIYLAPIDKDVITGGRLLNYYEFTHNYAEDNIDEFKGYNIYYKFYAKEADSIATDIASLENIYIATENTIRAKGFLPVCRRLTIDSLTPLISLASYKDENIKIRIDFANLVNSPQEEPMITVYRKNQPNFPIDRFVMRRNIQDPDNTGEYKTFLYDDLNNGATEDADCKTVATSIAAGQNIAVSICVVAYGWDSVFSPLFSEVVFLNRTKDTILAPLEIPNY